MDPGPKDIRHPSPDAEQDTGAALEMREPKPANTDATRPLHHDGSYGGVEEAMGRQQTESADGPFVVADDDRTSPAAAGTAVTAPQLLPSHQAVDDGSRDEERLSPVAGAAAGDMSTPPNLAAPTVADGESITDTLAASLEEVHTAERSSSDMVNLPISSAAPQEISSKQVPSPRNSTRSSPAPTEGTGGETDGEAQSYAEHNGQNGVEVELHDEAGQGAGDGVSGGEDEPNDLPSQLSRLWGASPPDRAEKLELIKDMLGYRGELDGILSKLMSAKVRGCHMLASRLSHCCSTQKQSHYLVPVASRCPGFFFRRISFNTNAAPRANSCSCTGTRPWTRSPRKQRGNPGLQQLPDITICSFFVHPGDPCRSFRPDGDRPVGAEGAGGRTGARCDAGGAEGGPRQAGFRTRAASALGRGGGGGAAGGLSEDLQRDEGGWRPRR